MYHWVKKTRQEAIQHPRPLVDGKVRISTKVGFIRENKLFNRSWNTLVLYESREEGPICLIVPAPDDKCVVFCIVCNFTSHHRDAH